MYRFQLKTCSLNLSKQSDSTTHTTWSKYTINHVFGCSHYILRLMISPMCWNHVPTEKQDYLAFILFSPPTCHKFSLQSHTFLGEKYVKTTKKCNKIHGFFLLFFPSSDMSLQAFFFLSFFPTSQEHPCRDPSIVEYNACALSKIKNQPTASLKLFAWVL